MAGDSSLDGEVQFKLQGPDGTTETDCLTLGTGGSDTGLFKAGGCDVFQQRGRDIGGAPTKLFANINHRGSCSSYALMRVDVVNTSTGEQATFKLGGNLYTWNWWTEIAVLTNVDYQVSTNISNTGSKDFDGQVFVTLVGADGTTKELPLLPPWYASTPFMPSACDAFTVNAIDVGQLQQVLVRVDKGASGTSVKLALEYINVVNSSSGAQVSGAGWARANCL